MISFITSKSHGESVSGSSSDWLHVVSILHSAGEGGHSALPRLDGSVCFKMLVYEDKSASCEVSLVVREVK